MTFWVYTLMMLAHGQVWNEQVEANTIKELILEAEVITEKIRANDTNYLCGQLDSFDHKRVLFLNTLANDPHVKRINLSKCPELILTQAYKNRLISHFSDFLKYLKSTWKSFNQNLIGDLYRKTLREDMASGSSKDWPTWK